MGENYENPMNSWCFRKSRSISLEEEISKKEKFDKKKYNKKWRKENPDYMRKWRKENPDYMRKWNGKNSLKNSLENEIQKIEEEISEIEKNEIIVKYKKLKERKECCLKLLRD